MNKPSRVLALVLSCVAVLLAPVWQGGAQAQAAPPRIECAGLRIAFDSATGQLVEFTGTAMGHPFLACTPGDELWTIQLSSSSAAGAIGPSDAQAFHYRRPVESEHALELVWQDFGIAEAPRLRVTATVFLAPDEPLAFWRLAIDEMEGIRPRALHFPRIPGIAPQEHEVLAAPIWMGQLADNPRRTLCRAGKPKRFEWAYPGKLSLQCLALYQQDGPGLYLGADDTAGFAKRFCVFGEPTQRLGFEVVHLPQADSDDATSYETPYRVTLGAFRGDWFTVAERYRRWALEQPWAKESRLHSGAVADWVEDTGVWVWNRGRSDQVLTPAVTLQKQTGLPVSVFWHWWHGCSYDVGFPEYLPPREGEQPFREAVGKAREAGVHAMVYMNQRLWGMTTDSWEKEGAEQYAVKRADGKIHPEYYNTFDRAPCASMCMGTPFWRDKYAGLSEQAVVDLGVDGIYMDQACLSLACYDPTHGHPVGGGTYWMNGFRMLQADIRARCLSGVGAEETARSSSPNVVLAGEGCGEAWLPYLDLMLSLQVSMERYAVPGLWRPVPMFHAVYHGRAVLFGNYSSLTMPPYDELWPKETAPKEPLKLLDTKFSQQFRLEHARAFVWGQQPTLANFRPQLLEERPEEIDYFVHLAKLRLQGLKYLLRGTMLRPPELNLPQEEIDISRLSIYAGQKGALRQYRKPCAAVLASAWQAPDGDVCIVLANVSRAAHSLSIALPRDQYPVPRPCALFRIDADGEREVELPAGDLRLDLALPPANACIYEFRKKQTD